MRGLQQVILLMRLIKTEEMHGYVSNDKDKPNMALKWDARNAGFGFCRRLHGRPLAQR
jgi:hypothetical protein